MKHAYLIMAHSDPSQLNRLVQAIDDERNDIFVHIDKKADISLFNGIKTIHSHLIFVNDRIDTHWGDASQIDTEYVLFRTASQYGEYNRFHLLSGADFPLKSQNFIHTFFEKYPTKEFIDFEGSEIDEDKNKKGVKREIYKKCHLYHFFLSSLKDRNRVKANFLNLVRRGLMLLQMGVGMNRKFSLGILFKGSQWGSYTNKFVECLIEKEEVVKREFRFTHCCDEIYKQTIAMAENFEIAKEGNLRLIDFSRGSRQSPYIFKEEDLNELLGSDKLFARKFSSKESGFLCERLKEKTGV